MSLLTEQELRDKVNWVFYAHDADEGKHAPESFASECKACTEELVDLIQSQKLAHADMVIGEDEKMKDGEDTNQLIAATNQRLRKRNRLRAEQRERNK